MTDTSKTAAAEAAFPEAYRGGMPTVTRITVIQGQFRFDQLIEWFPVVDRAFIANDFHPTTGAVMEICNRIRFGLRDESRIADARRVVGDLGIAQGALVFKQERPVLLGQKPGLQLDLQPMRRWVKRQFREVVRSTTAQMMTTATTLKI